MAPESTLDLSHVTHEGKMKPGGVSDVSGPQNSKFWEQDSVWVPCPQALAPGPRGWLGSRVESSLWGSVTVQSTNWTRKTMKIRRIKHTRVQRGIGVFCFWKAGALEVTDFGSVTFRHGP